MSQNIEPHISILQDRLFRQFMDLCDEKMDPKRAVETNNTAGKLMSTYKTQITYHALRGEAPVIPFLAAPVEAKQPALTSGHEPGEDDVQPKSQRRLFGNGKDRGPPLRQ